MQFYIKSLRTTPLDHLITTIFINYIDRALDSLTADIKDSGNDIVMTIQDKYFYIILVGSHCKLIVIQT